MVELLIELDREDSLNYKTIKYNQTLYLPNTMGKCSEDHYNHCVKIL